MAIIETTYTDDQGLHIEKRDSETTEIIEGVDVTTAGISKWGAVGNLEGFEVRDPSLSTVSLAEGFKEYGGEYEPVSVRKNELGEVKVYGLVRYGAGDIPAGTIIGQITSFDGELFPKSTIIRHCTANQGKRVRVDIKDTGEIVLKDPANLWINLGDMAQYLVR